MNLKVTVWVIAGFGILGLLLGGGYLISQNLKLNADLKGGLPSPGTPAMTTTSRPITTANSVNGDQMTGNHTINLPGPITPAGLPMHNLTPGITLNPSTTKVIPPTPGLR